MVLVDFVKIKLRSIKNEKLIINVLVGFIQGCKNVIN